MWLGSPAIVFLGFIGHTISEMASRNRLFMQPAVTQASLAAAAAVVEMQWEMMEMPEQI